MTERIVIPSTARWVQKVGYSRAIRVGNVVYVAGTAPVDEKGSIAHRGDPYGQARRAIEIILEALAAAGAEARHVVRTRMYVTPEVPWEEVGRAHGEIFSDILPVTTLIQVAGFVDNEILVEIEAEAVI